MQKRSQNLKRSFRWGRLFVGSGLALGLCFMSLEASKASSSFGRHSDREDQAYALDTKRAQDMSSAWASLRQGVDDDHYVKLVAKSSRWSSAGFEVVSVSAHGTMLTIQMRKLNDEDEKKGLSLRAREVDAFVLQKRPW